MLWGLCLNALLFPTTNGVRTALPIMAWFSLEHSVSKRCSERYTFRYNAAQELLEHLLKVFMCPANHNAEERYEEHKQNIAFLRKAVPRKCAHVIGQILLHAKERQKCDNPPAYN